MNKSTVIVFMMKNQIKSNMQPWYHLKTSKIKVIP